MRKLDAAIAEALGWTKIGHKDYSMGMSTWWGNPPKPKIERFGDERDTKDIPMYSTDGNAMLELLAEMIKRKWIFQSNYYQTWQAEFIAVDNEGLWTVERFANADTLPEAVALAAYKALTGQEWEDA